MTTPFLEPPTDFTAFELAEWLETSMLLSGEVSISAAAIEAAFPVNQRPDGAEIDQLFAEVRARAEAAATLYPFRARDDEVLSDRDVDGVIYRFLLVLSMESAPYRTESRYNEISPLLELITREAMLALFGGGGEARRFGWPVGDGRPEPLAEAVRWLAGEMALDVNSEVLEADIDDADKDGGIDVAAWHPFADGGPSFPSFLIQVTTQATYERKPADVVPEQWVSWIRFGREPSVGLTVPFAVPADAKVRLSKLRYRADLLLDRLRLCQLLEQRRMQDFDEHELMEQWTADEVEKIKAALSEREPAKRPRLARKRRPTKESAERSRGNAPAAKPGLA